MHQPRPLRRWVEYFSPAPLVVHHSRREVSRLPLLVCLRRTCAKLCRKAGGQREQTQLLLGHASIQTAERYLGTVQNLTVAVSDVIG